RYTDLPTAAMITGLEHRRPGNEESMAFTVSIDSDNQLVHIVHYGDIDARDLFLGRETLGRELNQHHYRRALVDVRQMDTPPDTMDTFELSSSHHNHLPANTRIAVIVNPRIEPD